MVEHPGWHSVFDTLPATAANTRRRMIQSVTDSGAVVVASHIPTPGRIVGGGSVASVFAPLGYPPAPIHGRRTETMRYRTRKYPRDEEVAARCLAYARGARPRTALETAV
jgi:hypothetical protein